MTAGKTAHKSRVRIGTVADVLTAVYEHAHAQVVSYLARVDRRVGSGGLGLGLTRSAPALSPLNQDAFKFAIDPQRDRLPIDEHAIIVTRAKCTIPLHDGSAGRTLDMEAD